MEEWTIDRLQFAVQHCSLVVSRASGQGSFYRLKSDGKFA